MMRPPIVAAGIERTTATTIETGMSTSARTLITRLRVYEAHAMSDRVLDVLSSLGIAIVLGGAAHAQPTPTTPEPDEPAAPAVELSVGGYVEAYYQAHFQNPSNHVTTLRGFDSRDRMFTLSNVALDVKGTRGPVTAHVTLQVGAAPTIYYGAEQQWKYIQQATLAYTAGSGLVVDAGLFPSPVGAEVIPIKDNWNWSRSDLFFGLPFYHTGVRAAYPLGHGWTGMIHVYNGWNSVEDNNPYPSVGVSAAYASDKVTGQVLYFGGIERPTGAPEGKAWRHLLDAYATISVTDQVSVLVHADGGVEPNDLGTSGWFAAALYGKFILSPRLYAAARADYFREWVATSASPIFWPTPWIASGTATVAYQPVDGLSVRLEYRHDHAKSLVFFGGDVVADTPNRDMQDTVTLGATAWF
jgi:hypothetical protein